MSGVTRDKLVVVAEPVSTAFFDPAVAQPMPMPVGDLVFGAEPAASAPADFAFLSVPAANTMSAATWCRGLRFLAAGRRGLARPWLHPCSHHRFDRRSL